MYEYSVWYIKQHYNNYNHNYLYKLFNNSQWRCKKFTWAIDFHKLFWVCAPWKARLMDWVNRKNAKYRPTYVYPWLYLSYRWRHFRLITVKRSQAATQNRDAWMETKPFRGIHTSGLACEKSHAHVPCSLKLLWFVAQK